MVGLNSSSAASTTFRQMATTELAPPGTFLHQETTFCPEIQFLI